MLPSEMLDVVTSAHNRYKISTFKYPNDFSQGSRTQFGKLEEFHQK